MSTVVQRLLSRLQSKLSRSPYTKRRKDNAGDRRLTLEALEFRRVLAASISSFSPTASGFLLELTEQVSTQNLSLYDSESGVAGAADVTLQGEITGDVRGSLVVSGTTLSFVATGGPLAADTYTVTLRSATDAFIDLADGELLDGDNDGVAGGDYLKTFTVINGSSLVVGLPDIVRGPTQPIQVPAAGSGASLPAGLPIQLSDAAGVTSVTLTIQYDPALLEISSVQLGVDAPIGSQVESNLTVPGLATIAYFSLEPMAAGQADIVDIIASVPENAIYGSAQTIHITSLSVNAGGMAASADDAIHVVAFPGDVNANRKYDAEDARLIARVGVGLDTGFVSTTPTSTIASTRLFPTIDPVLLGDVTGIDGISPLDASDILRRVVGLTTPNIPALPEAQGPTSLTLSNLSVGENQAIGTTVGFFTTFDPDANDSHTYSLVSGTGDTDNAAFSIVGSSLVTTQVFDASFKDSYSIRVQTTDSTGRTLQTSFAISITEQNLAPIAISLSNLTITENQPASSIVGTLSTTDSDIGDTFTYSVVSVDGNTASTIFAISGDSLIATVSLDFETQSTFVIAIRSTDQGGLSVDQIFTVSVIDANDAPTAITLSSSTIEDGSPVGTVVGTLSTSNFDPLDTLSFSLVAGDGDSDNASFTIIGDQLQSAATIDFSLQSSYSVRVQVLDSSGGTFEQSFTITLGNAAPTAVILSNFAITENGVDGNIVGTLTTTDATIGDNFSYSLVAGDGDTNNSSFMISGDQLVALVSFDAESTGALSVRIRSTDSMGGFVENVFSITVDNVNESLTTVTLSANKVADGEPSGTVIGTLGSDDPDVGDVVTYSLVSGEGDTDNSFFFVSGNQLMTAFVADQLTQPSYTIRVLAQDLEGLGTEQSFTITVTETNVSPTALMLDNNAIPEDAAIGTNVGSFTTTDANVTDTFSYALVSGEGDTDNAAFQISGDNLVTAIAFDFETQSSYSIRVQSTDSFGASLEQTFLVSVTDVNESPTSIAIDNASLADEAAVGTIVGMLTTNDVDASDTFTYSLVGGDGDTDNASFAINGANLVTAAVVDFDTQSSYSVRVQSSDLFGLTVEQTFTISVTDGNHAPTAIAIDNDMIAEDATIGTVVGLLSTTDANATDTFTYALVSGEGDTDNASFAISGDSLVTANTLDFETQSSYMVRVQSTDSFGAFVEQAFMISVANVNEAPTGITLDFPAVASGEPAGTLIGVLGAVDPDASDTFVYSFVSGEGDLDNDKLTLVNGELRMAEATDQAIQALYLIRVRVEDAGGLFFEDTASLIVTDANVAPTAITLENDSVLDGAASGTIVGTIWAVDANEFDVHMFELVAGDGDSDNASFSILDGKLVTNFMANSATQSSYSIRVMVQDRYGLTLEQELAINISTELLLV